jgi:hypothetical protein
MKFLISGILRNFRYLLLRKVPEIWNVKLKTFCLWKVHQITQAKLKVIMFKKTHPGCFTLIQWTWFWVLCHDVKIFVHFQVPIRMGVVGHHLMVEEVGRKTYHRRVCETYQPQRSMYIVANIANSRTCKHLIDHACWELVSSLNLQNSGFRHQTLLDMDLSS